MKRAFRRRIEPLEEALAFQLGRTATLANYVRVQEVRNLGAAVRTVLKLGARRVAVSTRGMFEDSDGHLIFGEVRVHDPNDPDLRRIEPSGM